MNKTFIVTATHEQYVEQAKVLEILINQPSVIKDVEARTAKFFEAIANGYSYAEALSLVVRKP